MSAASFLLLSFLATAPAQARSAQAALTPAPGSAAGLPPLPDLTYLSYSDAAKLLLARYKAASGGDAWDLVRTVHSAYALTANGSKYNSDGWDDVLDGRTVNVYKDGGVLHSSGYDGKREWTKDGNQPPVPNDDPAGQRSAVTEAYLVSNSYWYSDRIPGDASYKGSAKYKGTTYDVVELDPSGGNVVQMWFDRSTGLPIVVVEQDGKETSNTYPQRWRPVAVPESTAVSGNAVAQAAILTPGDVVQSSGDSDKGVHMHLASIQINAEPPDHVFDMPAEAAVDYRYKRGIDSVTVPFQYIDGHIYIPVKINGHAERAMFDTGGAYIIGLQTAADIGMVPHGSVEIGGIGQHTMSGYYADADSISVGGYTVKNPAFTVIGGMNDPNADAIVGPELMERFVVSINFDASTMTFTRPSAFHYAGAGKVAPIRLYARHMPMVDGSVDGLPGSFTIDTGDFAGLTLNGPYILANDLKTKYHPKFTVIAGYGVGGQDNAYVVRVKDLTLGGVTAHGCVTYLHGGKSGIGADRYVSGNVGTPVLRQFNLIFDYPEEKMIFEPNKAYGAADAFQRTGIVYDGTRMQPTIAEVLPDSPAREAGLKVGDVVLSIDGVKAQDLLHPAAKDPNASYAAYSKFKADNIEPAGTSLTLQVRHLDGGLQTVTLVLRDLL